MKYFILIFILLLISGCGDTSSVDAANQYCVEYCNSLSMITDMGAIDEEFSITCFCRKSFLKENIKSGGFGK